MDIFTYVDSALDIARGRACVIEIIVFYSARLDRSEERVGARVFVCVRARARVCVCGVYLSLRNTHTHLYTHTHTHTFLQGVVDGKRHIESVLRASQHLRVCGCFLFLVLLLLFVRYYFRGVNIVFVPFSLTC